MQFWINSLVVSTMVIIVNNVIKSKIEVLYDSFSDAKYFKLKWPVTRAYAKFCKLNPDSRENTDIQNILIVLKEQFPCYVIEYKNVGKVVFVGFKDDRIYQFNIRCVRLSSRSFNICSEIYYGILLKILDCMDWIETKFKIKE